MISPFWFWLISLCNFLAWKAGRLTYIQHSVSSEIFFRQKMNINVWSAWILLKFYGFEEFLTKNLTPRNLINKYRVEEGNYISFPNGDDEEQEWSQRRSIGEKCMEETIRFLCILISQLYYKWFESNRIYNFNFSNCLIKKISAPAGGKYQSVWKNMPIFNLTWRNKNMAYSFWLYNSKYE